MSLPRRACMKLREQAKREARRSSSKRCGSDAALELGLGAIAAYPGERPVGDLLRAIRHEGAPGCGADRTLRLPYDLELTVAPDFADEHRFVEVMILRVHHDVEAGRRANDLAADCLAHGIHVRRARLLHRLRPHLDADVRRF